MLRIIEKKITEFWTNIFRQLLFFLNDNNKSSCVSFIHYIIFIAGFAYFFFISNPRDIFRIFFFIFLVLSALSYFIFNKCFFTCIELSLSPERNFIQRFICKYFGKEIEGNITSKIVLSFSSLIIGLIILNDYEILNIIRSNPNQSNPNQSNPNQSNPNQ
jgi:hypothetical protein